jgi:hypothetical protein
MVLLYFVVSLAAAGIVIRAIAPVTSTRRFCLCVLMLAIAATTKGWMDREVVRREAIDHGYAEYHPQTGEWRWIEQEQAQQKGGE